MAGQPKQLTQQEDIMMSEQDNAANSLAHTKWNCKYHVVFAPKYRRKVFYNEKREDIREIIRTLCKWKSDFESWDKESG